MASINYKTTEKPAIQRGVIKALNWIGVRQTSYSEIAKDIGCTSSDARYAVLDLLEKGYIVRHQTKGYAGATRGFRYAYEVTKEGQEWFEKPVKQEEPKEEVIPGLFE